MGDDFADLLAVARELASAGAAVRAASGPELSAWAVFADADDDWQERHGTPLPADHPIRLDAQAERRKLASAQGRLATARAAVDRLAAGR